jgi:hypothetical protein
VQGGNLNFDGIFSSFGTFTRGSVAGGTANAGCAAGVTSGLSAGWRDA